MDAWVLRDTHTADSSTKVKQTDRGLLYYFRLVPDNYKLNLIYNLINRIYNIASNMLIFHLDFEHLKRQLKMNSFPQDLIDRTANKVLTNHRLKDQPRDKTVEKSYGVKSDHGQINTRPYMSHLRGQN